MIHSTLAKDSSLDDSNYILDYRLDRNDNETNQDQAREDGEASEDDAGKEL